MGLTWKSFLNPFSLITGLPQPNKGSVAQTWNLPKKVSGEALAGVFGRKSWMGSRFARAGNRGGSLKDLMGFGALELGNLNIAHKAIEQEKADATVAQETAAARKAAHDAEVAQLGQDALGAVSMRRKRGMYATMLTGVGANPSSTGKTVLGS